MTGNVNTGFTAEFVPIEVGIYMILVKHKGVAVGGTPYYSSKISRIPTLIGTNSAVNPFLTLPVTLTGISSVGPRKWEKNCSSVKEKVIVRSISGFFIGFIIITENFSICKVHPMICRNQLGYTPVKVTIMSKMDLPLDLSLLR